MTAEAALRLDKWLWFARFFRTRTRAAEVCAARRVRVNHQVAARGHVPVRAGDVLTFPQGNAIRVVRVLAIAERRGSAPQARLLYQDLTPETPAPPPPVAVARDPGSGRPTKAERRAVDRLKDGS